MNSTLMLMGRLGVVRYRSHGHELEDGSRDRRREELPDETRADKTNYSSDGTSDEVAPSLAS